MSPETKVKVKSCAVAVNCTNPEYAPALENLMFACHCRSRAALIDLALAVLAESRGLPILPPRMRPSGTNGNGYKPQYPHKQKPE